MPDFNKIKQIMKDSVEKKLVIVDDEDSYVLITLDEYQQLLERSNLVAKIQGKTKADVSEAEISKASWPPEKLSNVTNNLAQSNLSVRSIKTSAEDIQDINQDLDNLTDNDNFEPEIRYESLNDEFSEEPI